MPNGSYDPEHHVIDFDPSLPPNLNKHLWREAAADSFFIHIIHVSDMWERNLYICLHLCRHQIYICCRGAQPVEVSHPCNGGTGSGERDKKKKTLHLLNGRAC